MYVCLRSSICSERAELLELDSSSEPFFSLTEFYILRNMSHGVK